MELRDYLVVLRKYWLSIVAITVLGIAAAACISLLMKPVYTAQTAVFLSVNGGNSASDLVQGANYASNQVNSFAQVVTTPVVLQPVIDKLGLDTTPAELAKSITTTIPTNTAIVQIAVKDTSAAQSATIAQAVSESLVAGVQKLSPADTTGSQTVAATILTPATVPTAWTSPNVLLNLALGFLVGLAIGVGQALLRNILDLSIRDEDDVARATDHSVIVRIPFDPSTGDHPLIGTGDTYSPRTEAYRRLRTNLQFVDVGSGRQHRTFVMTSSLASEGKTTTAINVATSLAEIGDRVLLIDGDLRRPQVARSLGIDGSVGLTTLLIGRAQPADVIQRYGASDLHVLPSGQIPPNPTELLGSDAMGSLLEVVTARYDTVIIDAAPLLPVADGAILAAQTHGALVVAACGEATIPDLRDAIGSLDQVNATTLGVILNKSRSHSDAYYYYYDETNDPKATHRKKKKRRSSSSSERSAQRRQAAARRASSG